jgi:hypothetical protein
MRRFLAPSSGLDKFFAAQFSADYITNMPAFDLRLAQQDPGAGFDRSESSQQRSVRAGKPVGSEQDCCSLAEEGVVRKVP